jgi:hypothetical protein
MSASYIHHWGISKWKNWKATRLSDSDSCSEYELKRRALHLGIPVAQLRWVPSYRPDPVSLLERRMKLLSLDPDEIVRIEPDVTRTLRHQCARCVDLERCALDLTDTSADPCSQRWRDYCPNAATLTALSTLQSCTDVSK